MTTALDVVLCSIGLPHDGLTLGEKSLGGSETAAIHVARCLAQRGHRVSVFAPLPPRPGPLPRVIEGVSWFPIEQFVPFASSTPHDVTVISRDVNQLRYQFTSSIRVLWCHDLALKRLRGAIGQSAWTTDYLYVLSAFQQAQYRDIYGFPDSYVFVTRNGVDVARMPRERVRDPLKLVYGSRPERGLETALDIMARLAARGSALRLEVSMYDHEGLAPQVQGYYQQLWQRAQTMPNVVLRGALTQAQWHEQLATARALLYPGAVGQFAGFREISCIVMAEAQACGTPVVAIAQGAIPETLHEAGILVGDETTNAGDTTYREAFTDAVVTLATDDLAWQRHHARARANAPALDWMGVATQWEAHWLATFDARNADPWRVQRANARAGERDL